VSVEEYACGWAWSDSDVSCIFIVEDNNMKIMARIEMEMWE
jgi:hypothetical protein